MTAVTGQASVEYAGLLGLAAVLGAALALVAGPPLLGAVRNAFVAALSGRAHSPAPVVAGAADIADVQSALLPTTDGLTPDAALLALGRGTATRTRTTSRTRCCSPLPARRRRGWARHTPIARGYDRKTARTSRLPETRAAITTSRAPPGRPWSPG